MDILLGEKTLSNTSIQNKIDYLRPPFYSEIEYADCKHNYNKHTHIIVNNPPVTSLDKVHWQNTLMAHFLYQVLLNGLQ